MILGIGLDCVFDELSGEQANTCVADERHEDVIAEVCLACQDQVCASCSFQSEAALEKKLSRS